jgi:hypothetical protein
MGMHGKKIWTAAGLLGLGALTCSLAGGIESLLSAKLGALAQVAPEAVQPALWTLW